MAPHKNGMKEWYTRPGRPEHNNKRTQQPQEVKEKRSKSKREGERKKGIYNVVHMHTHIVRTISRTRYSSKNHTLKKLVQTFIHLHEFAFSQIARLIPSLALSLSLSLRNGNQQPNIDNGRCERGMALHQIDFNYEQLAHNHTAMHAFTSYALYVQAVFGE